MPSKRHEWLTRIKAVEREYKSIHYATVFLRDAVADNPSSLKGELRVRDLDEASRNLEGTYIIRLFSEFETCLRAFWMVAYGQPPTRTRDLLDGVGARRIIPFDQINNAHRVREFRNSLVHARNANVEPIPIDRARSILCHYSARLPIDW